MSGRKSCCCELLPLRTVCIVIAIIGSIIGTITWSIAIHMTTGFLYDDRVILLTSLGVISLLLDIALWLCLILGIFLNNAKFIFATLIELVLIIAIRIGVAIFLLTYFRGQMMFGIPFFGSIVLLIPLVFHFFSFVVIVMFYRTLDRDLHQP